MCTYSKGWFGLCYRVLRIVPSADRRACWMWAGAQESGVAISLQPFPTWQFFARGRPKPRVVQFPCSLGEEVRQVNILTVATCRLWGISICYSGREPHSKLQVEVLPRYSDSVSNANGLTQVPNDHMSVAVPHRMPSMDSGLRFRYHGADEVAVPCKSIPSFAEQHRRSRQV